VTNVAAMLSLYIRCLSGPRVVYASKTSLSETVADRQYSTVQHYLLGTRSSLR
jgi:hypothetical protein